MSLFTHSAALRAYGFLLLLTALLALPHLVRGRKRRGHGHLEDSSFGIQRAPQVALGVILLQVIYSLRAVPFALGTRNSWLGERLFTSHPRLLSVTTLAPSIPANWAAPVAWAGVLCAVGGALLLLGGLHGLGRSFSTAARIVPEQTLRVDGPFRFVLHPIYAGYIYLLIGGSMTAWAPAPAVLTLVVLVPLLTRRAKYEERLLTAHFGEAYRQYADSRRWHRFTPCLRPTSR